MSHLRTGLAAFLGIILVCISPAVSQVLTLEVNTPTGRTLLINGAAQAIDFDFYEIASPAGSLNPAGWVSLQDMGLDDNGVPNDGIGWEELGTPDASLLAEAFLFGSTVVADADRFNLGFAFTPGLVQDLTFNYQAPDGTPFNGNVVFDATVLGDMDGNGTFDAFDVDDFELALADSAGYIAAHPGLDPDILGDIDGSGVLDAFDVDDFEALLAGATAGPAQGMLVSSVSVAVPEPGALVMLVGMGGAAGLIRRRH